MADCEGVVAHHRGAWRQAWSMILQHWKLLVINVAVLSFTLVVLVGVGMSDSSNKQVCRSTGCNKTARAFLRSMNGRESPCEDFYEFVCGNWNPPLSELLSDWNPPILSIPYTVNSPDFTDELIRLTEAINPGDIEALQQLKTFYRSCIAYERSEDATQQLVTELLDRMFMPEDSIGRTLAKIKREHWMSLIFYVGLEFGPHSRRGMVIDQPKLGKEELLNETAAFLARSEEVTKILDRFDIALPALTNKLGIFVPWEQLTRMILEFEKQLFMQADGHAITGNDSYISLEEINGLFHGENRSMFQTGEEAFVENFTVADKMGEMNWIEYMQTLFEDVPGVNVTPNYVVNVRNVEYVKRVGTLLATLPISQIRLSLIAQVLRELVDVLTPLSSLDVGARQTMCMVASQANMPFAAEHMLAVSKGSGLYKIRQMLAYAKVSFYSTISSVDWMDPATKSHAMGNVTNIRADLGYPDWVLTSTAVNKYYEGLNFKGVTGVALYRNQLTFARWIYRQKLEEFGPQYSRNTKGNFPSNLDTDDATVVRKAYLIPDGYLQFRHFGTGIPSVDYGALGANLGYVLEHIFDTERLGLKGNEEPKSWRKWKGKWSNESLAATTQCSTDQYKGHWKDGKQYIKENFPATIGDSGGIRAAFEAFKMYSKSRGWLELEQALPGFENYSSEQLFFISFAHSHCVYPGYVRRRLGWHVSGYTPTWIRVMGALANYEEFARAWQCPKGSGMNPEKKCFIWE